MTAFLLGIVLGVLAAMLAGVVMEAPPRLMRVLAILNAVLCAFGLGLAL